MREGKSLVVHPQVHEYQSDIHALRAQLAELLERMNHLDAHVGPSICADYLELFGERELILARLRVANGRMRRRIELIRKHLNRGELVSPDILAGIESQLDKEYVQWEENIQIQARAVETAKATPVLAPPIGYMEKLKHLYRRLVARLHPDVTGGETLEYKTYWSELTDAYESLDLLAVESIAAALGESLTSDEAEVLTGSLEWLEKEKSRLNEITAEQETAIETLLGSIPFSYEQQLSDPEWVKETLEAIEYSIDEEKGKQADLRVRMCEVERKASAGTTLH